MRRTAAEIAAGLAPARPARPIRRGERIHVVGAAGAGASAAVLLAAAAGAEVTGCDASGPSPYTPPLDAAGVRLAWAHDPVHVATSPPPDRLAVTKALTATHPDHPEILAARAAGVVVESWQQVVADAAVGRRLVGVAGTHGKSTTAGWLVHVLTESGQDPSAFVGALLPGAITNGLPATARLGAGPAFVVEADEYAGNFDPYRPSVAVITNVDWDHPDVFTDLEAVLAAFEAWLRAAGATGADVARGAAAAGRQLPIAVINVADAGGRSLALRLRDWPGRLLAAVMLDADPGRDGDAPRLLEGLGTAAGPAAFLAGRVTAADPDGTTLELAWPSLRAWGLADEGAPARVAAVRLAMFGDHNAQNAMGVAGAALALGVAPGAIEASLATFRGVGRRLERVGEAAGVVVYDDYGHHPSAIRATMAALRQREPGRRLWAVYEPLTFHRTAALVEDFAEVLAEADAVAVADIWAGRDLDTSIASAAGLAAAVARVEPGLEVAAPGSVDATADWLVTRVRTGDLVLVMGGGHSYRIGPRLLAALAATTGR